MNYGDPSNPQSGRAQVPGNQPEPPSPNPSSAPPAGRAQVGRAGVGGPGATGSASVGSARVGGSASVGSARVSPPEGPTGRASVGSARVGGSASVGSARVSPPEGPTGRASVGAASVPGAAGRATVGRAVVGSASVGVPDVMDGPGGPGGPGDLPPGAGGRGGKDGRSVTAKAKKRRRRNIMIASIAAFIMIAGIGMVAGTYYFDQVALPDDITLDQSTTIYYSDGVTPMSRIGENRTVLPFDQIPKDMQHAVVAAEDNSFYTNDGVDYKGVVRAAWNNVSGGDRQGASTISQQYARRWADLEGVTYARKVREAVIALKLNQQYSKDEIMTMYLNVVYFGRGAYGIEAASQAYFGKPAKDLKTNEAMLLAGLIKNPEGSGKGSPFDPNIDKAQALDRFNYIKGQMIKLNFVPEAEAADRMKFPDNVVTPADARKRSVSQQNLDKPEGLIVHHVLGEVAALTDPRTGQLLYEDTDADGKKNFDKIRNGGLKIVTTIDKDVQPIAVREASRNKDSNMNKQPENLQAALVAVEPGTGAVKAYYGGDDGSKNDYAGYYNDPVLGTGEDSCCGGHPPGSTFKVYTLTTGLLNGYRIDSMWDGNSPGDFPKSGRSIKGGNPVKNAGENPVSHPACGAWCTLEEVTVLSLNVPFFALAEKVGPDKVIDTARAAGITDMWATVKGQPLPVKIDLTNKTGKDVIPQYFNTEVAFGQYPVTVLEHAGGIATIAARGYAAKTHFLKEIWTGGKKTYGEVIKPQRIPGFTDGMSDDINTVLQGVPKHYNLKMKDGRQIAGKTGTWQYGQNQSGNAHAWMVGYAAYDPVKKTPDLAVAVWVGNKGNEQPIKDVGGKPIIGGSLPGPIWRDFLNDALTALKAPKVNFRPPANTGRLDVGTGISPVPSEPVVDPNNPGQDPNNPGNGNGGPGPGNGSQNPGGNGGGTVPTTEATRRR
ncbi:transglycosylase domain-containing protein [Dactylosporangium sp. CS-047395]|uniref:transglycosylase domain-containing protein n=1 Tax=Dactylosporangium sp. CS-047395 TaxID=3239936 RepID=UPI003D8D3DBD